jgi:hypothetical protein
LIDTERYGFLYNRPDIEEEVARAYDSDIPIHVAVPPDGHRWLVKRKQDKHGNRRHRNRLPALPAAPGPADAASPDQDWYNLLSDLDGTVSGEGPWGDRVLAGPGKYASTSEVYLRLRSNCENDAVCNDAGFFFHRQDLLSRGAEVYAGIFEQSFLAHLSYPRLFDSDWLMSSWLRYRGDWLEEVPMQPAQAEAGAPSTPLLRGSRALGITLVRPLGRHFSLLGSYSLRYQKYSRLAETDAGFTAPTSTPEHRAALSLGLHGRKLSVQAGLSLTRRSTWQPWGAPTPAGETGAAPAPAATPEPEASEPFFDAYRQAWVAAGFSTRLPSYQSIGGQVTARKGWDLDHFSSFWAGSDSMLRVAGFQSRRYHEGLGAVISYSRNIAERIPVTFSLEAASLRGGDGDVDRLGIAVDSILSGPFKTDIYLGFGYGLHSSLPGEAAKLRTNLILSRRF